jgi:hypothetical protein
VAGEQVAEPLDLDAAAGQRGGDAAQPRWWTGSRLKCGSDGNGAWLLSRASPSSNSASARRGQQACSSARNPPSRTRGKMASAWPRSLTHPTATGNLTSANTPTGLNHKLKWQISSATDH